MMKKEYVYHEILTGYFERKKTEFTQKEIATKYKISAGLVNKVTKELSGLGAISLSSKHFNLTDVKKLLVFWATKRNLSRDIVYSTHVNATAKEIESKMPTNTFFTAYTAYRLKYDDAPSDYDKVYVYANNLNQIKERFEQKKGNHNLFVIKRPDFIKDKISVDLIYVDLWNLKDWFANEYLKSLERKLFNE